jgi:hypothetical protein
MHTVQEIRAIVAECSFEDWQIEVRMDGTRPFLQVHVLNGKDAETGLPMEWTGRKWMLSPHMCKNEIVATAFKAVMTAMEHEVRELFRYKGVAIFNPHQDPDALVDFLSNRANIQERENVAFSA